MELGGDFELDIIKLHETEDTIFHYLDSYQTIYTDSGRGALRLLLETLPEGTVLLPGYICESVIREFRANWKLVFYRIRPDFSIDLEDLEKKLDTDVCMVYLMHYFGKLQSDAALHYIQEKKQIQQFVVVEDTTHSIFSKPSTIGDYCVCSLRKWFPIMDGGVLYTCAPFAAMDRQLEKKQVSKKLDAMLLKQMFLSRELDCNALYRKLFAEAEADLDEQTEIFAMSDWSALILRGVSVSEMCAQRRQNYAQLAQFFAGCEADDMHAVFQKLDFIPLVFPIYVSRRDAFRRYLIENQIYCAVHWPIQDTELENDTCAALIAERILSIPIDQRYQGIHMEYVKHVIENYS